MGFLGFFLQACVCVTLMAEGCLKKRLVADSHLNLVSLSAATKRLKLVGCSGGESLPSLSRSQLYQ